MTDLRKAVEVLTEALHYRRGATPADAAAETLIHSAETLSPPSRLLLAARLAQAGLIREARDTLAPLVQANTSESRFRALFESLPTR